MNFFYFEAKQSRITKTLAESVYKVYVATSFQICTNVCTDHTVHQIPCVCFRRRIKNTITSNWCRILKFLHFTVSKIVVTCFESSKNKQFDTKNSHIWGISTPPPTIPLAKRFDFPHSPLILSLKCSVTLFSFYGASILIWF